MKTQNIKCQDHYHIKGEKHWAGLTGIADYWITTSRELKEDGNIGRDIDFFISDNSVSEQKIKVSKYYNTSGLEIIPYGLNHLDIQLPIHQKLEPNTTGIKMMLDCLHRSRINFAGMGIGFINRLMEEAIVHCSNRKVSGKKLIEYAKVKERIAMIQSAFTINSSMCHYACKTTDLNKDLSSLGIEANCIKSLLTDIMQESAQSLVQLKGGNGYIKDKFVGRAIMDSRPFQIFEGSNDILYIQVGEAIVKNIIEEKQQCFKYYITKLLPAIAEEPTILFLEQIKIPDNKDQVNLHTFGEIYACLFSLNNVVQFSWTGFNKDLIIQAKYFLEKRITRLITKLHCPILPEVLLDYKSDSQWIDFS